MESYPLHWRVFHNISVMSRNLILHSFVDILIIWMAFSLLVWPENMVFPHNLMLYSVFKVLFSQLVCMYWPLRTNKPSLSEIFSLCSYKQGKTNGVQAIRQNISFREGLLVLEGQYIHMNRENKTLETDYNIRLWGKTVLWSSLSKKCHRTASKQSFQRKYWVTGTERLFNSNQIGWVLEWVCWCQLFSEEIKSNAVSKLFILVWSNEGMKVSDLGYEKSYEKFSNTPICHIFSNFPAGFHNA